MTNPKIARIAGYVVATTNTNNPVLRYFDSGDPYVRANAGYVYSSSSYDTWIKKFNPSVLWNDGRLFIQAQGLLPRPASLLPTFKVICQLDPLFAAKSIAAWNSPTATGNTSNGVLSYQTFYPQTNTVLANISMRYGTATDWYACPLTLPLTLHQ